MKDQSFLLINLGKISLHIGEESPPVLTDIGATLLVLNPATMTQLLLWSTKTVPTVAISNDPQEVPVLQSSPFCLGPPFEIYTLFFLSSSAPVHLLG